MFDERVRGRLASDPKLKAKLPQIERAVAEGRLSPALAVDEIVETLGV
jgi:LAO/AO transport system kinase